MAASKALLSALGVTKNADLFNPDNYRKFLDLADNYVVYNRTCCGVRELTNIDSGRKDATKKIAVAGVAAFLLGCVCSESDEDWDDDYTVQRLRDRVEDMDDEDTIEHIVSYSMGPRLRNLVYYGTKPVVKEVLEELGFKKFAEFYNPNSHNWVYGMQLVLVNENDPSNETF